VEGRKGSGAEKGASEGKEERGRRGWFWRKVDEWKRGEAKRGEGTKGVADDLHPTSRVHMLRMACLRKRISRDVILTSDSARAGTPLPSIWLLLQTEIDAGWTRSGSLRWCVFHLRAVKVKGGCSVLMRCAREAFLC
jgi:hypothetical protein